MDAVSVDAGTVDKVTVDAVTVDAVTVDAVTADAVALPSSRSWPIGEDNASIDLVELSEDKDLLLSLPA